jgi:predicted AAA+ superfamily ATPase
LDFAKHAPSADIPKLTLIWDSIPKHLARENKKFVFSAIKKGARARAYENGLTWLEDTGLIHRANAVETVKHPLKHYANTGCFKIYALDVGLLGAMAKSPVELLAQGKRLFNEYEGAFVENYVAQQLVSHFHQQLYYWRSKGGKAELDFLFEFQGHICPLEVKVGINPKSKSLLVLRTVGLSGTTSRPQSRPQEDGTKEENGTRQIMLVQNRNVRNLQQPDLSC